MRVTTMTVALALALAAQATTARAEPPRHGWVPAWANVQLPGPPWGTRVLVASGLAYGRVATGICARAAARYDFDGNVVVRGYARRCG